MDSHTTKQIAEDIVYVFAELFLHTIFHKNRGCFFEIPRSSLNLVSVYGHGELISVYIYIVYDDVFPDIVMSISRNYNESISMRLSLAY